MHALTLFTSVTCQGPASPFDPAAGFLSVSSVQAPPIRGAFPGIGFSSDPVLSFGPAASGRLSPGLLPVSAPLGFQPQPHVSEGFFSQYTGSALHPGGMPGGDRGPMAVGPGAGLHGGAFASGPMQQQPGSRANEDLFKTVQDIWSGELSSNLSALSGRASLSAGNVSLPSVQPSPRTNSATSAPSPHGPPALGFPTPAVRSPGNSSGAAGSGQSAGIELTGEAQSLYSARAPPGFGGPPRPANAEEARKGQGAPIPAGQSPGNGGHFASLLSSFSMRRMNSELAVSLFCSSALVGAV